MQINTDCNYTHTLNSIKDGLIAAIIYIFGVIIFTGNALASHSEQVIGHCESDVWKHLWGIWWMESELQRGLFPTWTNLQNFPSGGSLYIIDPLNAMLASFLEPLFGLIQAYNITLSFQLFAAALSCWCLAYYLTKSSAASLLAGAAYGFSPFMLTSGISSGIAETSNLAWLPLAVLGLLLGFNGQKPIVAVILGSLGLALCAFGSWYYGMAAMLFGLMLGIWTIIVKQTPTPYLNAPQWSYPILACLISGVLMFPLALMFASSLKGENSLLARIEITNRQDSSSMEFIHQKGNFKNTADIKSYLFPGKSNISIAEDVDRRLKSVYIGWTILLLASVGLYKSGKWTKFWLYSGIAAILLSVGPYFSLTPSISFAKPWNAFYMFAYNAVPGFRMVAILDRLSIIVQLCATILAALGLKRLLDRPWIAKYHLSFVFGIIATAVVLAEVIWFSPVPWPIPTSQTSFPQACIKLSKEQGNYGLIELPLNRQQASMQPGEYFYWQTKNKKPLPLALTTRFPIEMINNSLIGTLFLCEDPDYGEPPDVKYLASGLTALYDDGFRWIQVNPQLMSPTTTKKVTSILSSLIGKPEEFQDSSILYTIKPTTAQNNKAAKKS